MATDTDSYAFSFSIKFKIANERMTAASVITMDSIQLQDETRGHMGEKCQVGVSTGDVYTGVYRGFGEPTPANPLPLKLQISEEEAERIGVPGQKEIGIPFDVITSIEF